MIPPLFARISIRDGSRINLWIPLFLLWILLVPFVLLALPFVLLYLVLRKGLRGASMVFYFYQLMCALRGLDVDIKSEKSAVRIYVY